MTSRLDPWPYSAKISGVGLKLKPDPQTGVLMTGAKVQPFASVAPQDYSYSTTPPFLERSYNFRRFIMGMGERAQQFAIVRRYFYADGVDCSINGMPMLGMAFSTVTPSNTGEVRGFVEAQVGGTLKLFALCGRYINVRNADTGVGWLLSKDMGASATGRSAQRFKDAGGSPVDALYVTTDTDKLWQYTGATDTTTWTEISASVSATAADQKASYLELNNDLLVRSWENKVSTCASDPTVAANWSGTVFVGDSSQPITWLRVLGGTVFIFKTDGIYSIDSLGDPHSLFPSLRVTPNLANGRNASVWGQTLWARYGDSFQSIGPNTSGIIEMHSVGTERFIENDSPVRGYVTASEGWASWFNFIALYNTELNTSYLLKYGSWFVDDQPPLGSTAYVRGSTNPIVSSSSFFEPVLHGAIVSFPGKKITSMKVSSIPGPNERLYIGFSDGTISWGILPRGTPNPLADTNTAFQTSGKLFFGGHSMNFPGNVKSFRGVTMMGPRIDTGDTVTVDYRLSPSKAKSVGELSAYTVAQLAAFTVGDLGSGEYNALGEFTQSGQRIDLILADGTVGAAGTEIDLRLTLSSNGTSTPFIEGFALHEALRPDLLLTRDFVVEARDRMSRRDGSTDWRTAEQIRAVLQQAADAKGVVPMVMPDSNRINVEVVDYKEMMASEQTRSGNAWDIAITAAEFKSTIQFGTVARLAGYTIADLKQFQVLQLGVL